MRIPAPSPDSQEFGHTARSWRPPRAPRAPDRSVCVRRRSPERRTVSNHVVRSNPIRITHSCSKITSRFEGRREVHRDVTCTRGQNLFEQEATKIAEVISLFPLAALFREGRHHESAVSEGLWTGSSHDSCGHRSTGRSKYNRTKGLNCWSDPGVRPQSRLSKPS